MLVRWKRILFHLTYLINHWRLYVMQKLQCLVQAELKLFGSPQWNHTFWTRIRFSNMYLMCPLESVPFNVRNGISSRSTHLHTCDFISIYFPVLCCGNTFTYFIPFLNFLTLATIPNDVEDPILSSVLVRNEDSYGTSLSNVPLDCFCPFKCLEDVLLYFLFP